MKIVTYLILPLTLCSLTLNTLNQVDLMTCIEAADISIQQDIGLPKLPPSPTYRGSLQRLYSIAKKKADKLEEEFKDASHELSTLKMLQAATKNDLEQEKSAHKKTQKSLNECLKSNK